ncbi:hypothetical protein ACEUZ9_002765 [Paracoccus litorisediminis]|uniref:hypothetical protein n=1 Tax=Paracoccus litorisediminis TaxID=2006130 RepID=UPI0037331286
MEVTELEEVRASTIRLVGQALYGHDWAVPLADDLSIPHLNLVSLTAREDAVVRAPGIRGLLDNLISERMAALHVMRQTLRLRSNRAGISPAEPDQDRPQPG